MILYPKIIEEAKHKNEGDLMHLMQIQSWLDQQSGRDASVFITHAPCLDCSKLIYQSGISNVYYRNSYRDTAGIDFLAKGGISIEQHS